ncbi:MAG: CxxxxCH/CxxCH domain-containing protein [Labilithrix sp.]|nr:CxxxxCH/CxxCH domain-containing protein [Labilithrix sp.]MCW5812560.1 CxxxxCH/CxxCH domain-containing protein [Labilithrix sp.]
MRFWPLAVLGAVGAFAACERTDDRRAPVTYTDHVAPLFAARCVRCHGGAAPAGSWSAETYIGAIGCVGGDRAAAVASSDTVAPILAALDRPDHADVATASERATLATWIADGASRSGGGVHPAGFADPRSRDGHARFLRERRYAPMLDARDADACATCHDGARPAPGAPSCASCHAEPAAALACGTCHGDGARAYPPRSRCFHPEEREDRTHAAHATTLACTTCHPTPSTGAPSGVHANGYVDVAFDYAVAGRTARFDPNEKRCAGTCHARGGQRPAPAWGEARVTCNDCHFSPPPNHYFGTCTTCHHEANADGTAIAGGALHMNGKVDLGDGSGRCGACHGRGDDPWPATGAHAAHASPANGRPVPCETCHEPPGARHPEGRGFAAVRFTGLAVRGGRRASYDPATKTCAGTYCHDGAGGATRAPAWTAATATTCGSCHGAPPPPPHAQVTTCNGGICHEGRVAGDTLVPAARPAHVDGVVDHALR